MSEHLGAPSGAIAQRVLLPGDPLRAKWIAETFLEDVEQYNAVRNMLGFTGTSSDGRRVSVQGSGMGMPSLAIYVHELATEYGVKEIIRVGSCGALQSYLNLREIVAVTGSYYLPCPEASLAERYNFVHSSATLRNAAEKAAIKLKISMRHGRNISVDDFYNDDPSWWHIWAQTQWVLTVEMESWKLFNLAEKLNFQAFSILTISDYVPGVKDEGQQSVSSEERERTFADMVHIALAL